MADFIIEKGIPMKKYWSLPEFIKDLVEKLEVGDSFSFPMSHYLPVKHLLERKQKDWGKKFALRRVSENTARIWRTL